MNDPRYTIVLNALIAGRISDDDLTNLRRSCVLMSNDTLTLYDVLLTKVEQAKRGLLAIDDRLIDGRVWMVPA